jgi:outer membrane biosynthesis protein TonB
MKAFWWSQKLLLATIVLAVLNTQTSTIQSEAIMFTYRMNLQESAAASPLGKLNVPPEIMASHCLTMVSPHYPQTGKFQKPSILIVRAVIWKSGGVTPVRVISGDPSLEIEAMDAVRLWRYKPFSRHDEPIDVSTDVYVKFTPGTPGGIVTHPNH